MVFAMVLVGGATRLTDSGLSITEWKPILGIIPPLSTADWLDAFTKYQLIPEYTQINQGMSLSEFKFIFWWEWAHRFLGRIIGFVFFLPLVFFWMTGRIEKQIKPHLVFLLFLGGLQGAVGWWMVKSGLVDRVDVSQYRLAIHLIIACFIFVYAFWVAKGLAPIKNISAPLWLKVMAPIILLLTLSQIFLGGLVAGLDAGLAFNDWPLMDGAVLPDGLAILSPHWINWFENPKAVQFNHRMLAYFLFVVVFLQMLAARNIEGHGGRAKLLFAVIFAQAALGVTTLVLQVPLNWALAHQAGAIILLAVTVANWRAMVGSYPD
ncbi:MAG: heme A synthase [Hyphomicrobiales bacterium]|nr:MAG: heme A synthase [Hyphomicrobiales bacterium]